MSRYNSNTCKLTFMLVLTGVYFLVEITFGYVTHSMALIADSYHMLSDVLSLLIALICVRAAKKPASERNTFGWGRAEVLGAQANAIFLLALCFTILIDAIHRFAHPEPVNDPLCILIVGAVGLVTNALGLLIFRNDATMHHGHSHGVHHHGHSHGHKVTPVDSTIKSIDSAIDQKPTENRKSSLNMHGIFIHVLGDALGSLIVIINAIAVWKSDNEYVSLYLDPALSMLIVAIIISTAIPLLRASSLVLLQAVPDDVNVAALQRRVLDEIPDVVGVHELHVWQIVGERFVASLHVVTHEQLIDADSLSARVREIFHDAGVHSTTIQVEKITPSGDVKTPASVSLENVVFDFENVLNRTGVIPPGVAVVSIEQRHPDTCRAKCPTGCAPKTCCGVPAHAAGKCGIKTTKNSGSGNSTETLKF